MKNVIVVLLVLMTGGCGANAKKGGEGSKGQMAQQRLAQIAALPAYNLSEAQKADLLYMWEEEKLARDVYLESRDLWGSRIFHNISSSEQQHMDAISVLIKKYGLPTGTNGSMRGQFSIPQLQNLYNQLATRSRTSQSAALMVGKEIEELDIADLKSRMSDVTPDLQMVYSHLLEGSYRHLNAFNRQLGN